MAKRDSRLRDFGAEAASIREVANSEAEREIWDYCPIKQYVRQVIWLESIKKYLKQRSDDGLNSAWRYFTLPGANASDIGVLWREKLLSHNADGKLEVAICDVTSGDLVANNLETIGGILAYSKRKLEVEMDMKDKGTFHKLFPFDVINLDFCESLLPQSKVTGLGIVGNIFAYQRGQSFLLLITTKPDVSALAIYKGIVEANLADEDTFKSAYVEVYGNDRVESCMEDPTKFTQLVIPKMIAGLANSHGYRAIEHSAVKYGRPIKNAQDGQITSYDMICHTIELQAIHTASSPENARYKPRAYRPTTNTPVKSPMFPLPSNIQTIATASYKSFVSELPSREVPDVAVILKQEPELEQRLEQEADSLIRWWDKSNEEYLVS